MKLPHAPIGLVVRGEFYTSASAEKSAIRPWRTAAQANGESNLRHSLVVSSTFSIASRDGAIDGGNLPYGPADVKTAFRSLCG